MENKRYNILFIHTDQQRADTLGCYGNKIVKTPNIDRLAEQGTTFLNAHCSHPLCSPSRATWVTGEYIHSHGLWRNGTALSYDRDNVVKELNQNGYQTGAIGKIHLTPYHGNPNLYPESMSLHNVDYEIDSETCWEYWRNFDMNYFGYDHVRMTLGHGDYCIDGGHYGLWLEDNHKDKKELFLRENSLVDDKSYDAWKSPFDMDIHPASWIAEQADEFFESNADNPFFLSIGIPEPHPPFQPPRPYCDMYDPKDIGLPPKREGEWGDTLPSHIDHYIYRDKNDKISDRRLQEIIALYYGMVSLVDAAVGRILNSLEKQNLSDNTIVVYTSDHGDWMGDHGLHRKGAVHITGVTKVPMIIKWPFISKKNNIVNEVSSQIDLAATFYDASGIKPHSANQGTTLRNVVSGETGSVRDYALIEHRHECYDPDGGLSKNIFGHLKDERNREATQRDLINHLDRDIFMKTIVTDDYRFSYVPALNYGELFDHKNDPHELNNLWGKGTGLESTAMHRMLDVLIETTSKNCERIWRV